MFTGIVEEIGEIAAISKGTDVCSYTVRASRILEDMHIGDSIAVNGLCLTVISFNDSGFTADVMNESLRRSNLGDLKRGSRVNLERAMAAGGRFGGHIVSGHIDGTGIIRSYKREANAVWVTVTAGEELMRYIIMQGSVALDGVSLTVARVYKDAFAVSLIPHTGAETTLLNKRVGDRINIENDVVGKYVEKLCGAKRTGGGIDEDFLRKYGF
ncbi:MAG: riboflavin synthase [bacterium]|nr:riboflavin synthase [bacterium]